MIAERLDRVIAIATFTFLLGLVGGPARAQHPVQVFRADFQAAVDASDYTKMKSLVDGNRDYAMLTAKSYETTWCASTISGDDAGAAKVARYFEELAVVFKLQHRSSFLSDRKKWLLGLDEAGQTDHLESLTASDRGWISFDQGKQAGGDEPFRAALAEFVKSVQASTRCHDPYYAAQSADAASQCLERVGDFFGAAYYGRVCQRYARETSYAEDFAGVLGRLEAFAKSKKVVKPELIDVTIDLEGARAAHAKAVEEAQRVPAGAVSTGGGGDDSGGSKGTGNGGPVIVPPKSEAEFVFVDDTKFKETTLPIWSSIALPYYNENIQPGDPYWEPFVKRVVLEKDAAATESAILPGAAWRYDGKFYVDLDGPDGKGREKQVKLKQKYEKSKFKVHYDDDTKVELSYMLAEQASSWKLFGNAFKTRDAEKSLEVLSYNVTGMRGKIRGHDVTFIDGNSNGTYNDDGRDAVMVGKGRDVRIDPYGRYVFLEESSGWYPYEVKVIRKDVSLVRSRPFQGELAPVQVKWSSGSGKRPVYLTAKGSGEDAAFYFDLMKAIDKPMWVPAGAYTIHQGYLLDQDKDIAKALPILISRGRSGAFKVESGQLNTWSLGGAGEKGFWLLGNARRGEKPDEIVVIGKDTRCFGDFGEEYFNMLAERVLPTIEVKKDDGNGARVAKKEMKFPSGSDVTAIETFNPADLVLKNCPSGKLFFQMTAEHEILGKMASEWIEIID